MNCPSCGAAMAAQSLDGQLGATVDVDVCAACRVIWFDRYESLQLAPASTIRLFKLIADRDRTAPAPVREPKKCPRCDIRLLPTHDRQRNTPFSYWRCPREHGRLIGFFDFLREKDFVRPLSPEQLAELRRNVQTINCSNCGAPVDLVHDSACSHCGTPLSMIDLTQIADMAAQTRQAGAPADGGAPAKTVDIDALFEAIKAAHVQEPRSAPGLLDAGFDLIARWLS